MTRICCFKYSYSSTNYV